MCGIGVLFQEENIQLDISNLSGDFKILIEKILSQSASEKNIKKLNENELIPVLHRRGPDSLCERELQLETKNTKHTIKMFSSVLSIRGEGVTKQPLEDKDGNILMWNGEIFGGMKIAPNESDTFALSYALKEASSVIEVMKNIQGPWAFVYFERKNSTLWFGRNFIGQRSLMLHIPTAVCPYFAISSIAFGDKSIAEKEGKEEEEEEQELIHYDWVEVPNEAIFSIKMKENDSEKSILQLNETKWTFGSPYRPFGIRTLCEPKEAIQITNSKYIDSFSDALFNSVNVRVSNLPLPHDKNPNSARLGILFSGGIDSLLLSAIADKIVPLEQPIDLLNVAFGTNSFDVPDRKTGLNGLKELQVISKRKWNFVQVNVTPDEVKKNQEAILSLIYPSDTVMDITIGTALWFASRGEGILYSSEKQEDENSNSSIYKSPVRILLNGLGADEQLAGYARHRGVFKHRGWQGLQEELEKDFYRLWKRNLGIGDHKTQLEGRDDRIISDHGREVRFPFLDENFVTHLNTIPLYEICNLNLQPGVGDKMILRQLGKKLGLTDSTLLAKRAIQFGSRINKVFFPSVSGGKINGHAKFNPNSK